MDYTQTIDYLYQLLPVFHREGKKAFKPGLDNIIHFLNHLGNPHLNLKCIHIAGTNGKGSCSHLLSSVLQEKGYKVGLYTSPHLKDFTERIKINGIEIPRHEVVSFVGLHQKYIETNKPSFFELTVALAFNYLSIQEVDFAVIEVGLGGRLDSTNIITPILSFITNISFDHQDILGDTLQLIANEKAGIIKPQIPIVISENQSEIKEVFENTAFENNAKIYFANDFFRVKNRFLLKPSVQRIDIVNIITNQNLQIDCGLSANYQLKNIVGVLKVIDVLNAKYDLQIDFQNVSDGFEKVISNTNFKGRWQIMNERPLIVCDTGHNEAGIEAILDNLSKVEYAKLTFILGFVKDKDITKILNLFPKNADYLFCEADSPRSLSSQNLKFLADNFGLNGREVPNVNTAIATAKEFANIDDVIVVCGSNFLVGEINNL